LKSSHIVCRRPCVAFCQAWGTDRPGGQ
jgi:hypothetical protein